MSLYRLSEETKSQIAKEYLKNAAKQALYSGTMVGALNGGESYINHRKYGKEHNEKYSPGVYAIDSGINGFKYGAKFGALASVPLTYINRRLRNKNKFKLFRK